MLVQEEACCIPTSSAHQRPTCLVHAFLCMLASSDLTFMQEYEVNPVFGYDEMIRMGKEEERALPIAARLGRLGSTGMHNLKAQALGCAASLFSFLQVILYQESSCYLKWICFLCRRERLKNVRYVCMYVCINKDMYVYVCM